MNTGSQIDPKRFGKYELRELLGRGGMAEVWKAFDTQLERYVAIKLLHADLQADPEFMTRFTREAKVIASLHHPNIVQIHDFQIYQPPESKTPIAYMVMDYVEGQTLADYIRSTSRMGRFPPTTEIVGIFAAISRAIDYAHQQGMIHRDIKPGNILLDQRHITKQNPMGEPILTDFGIAKLMGSSSGTVSGSWLGTPLYISPEQAQGQPGNERSDIYSLGVILYEMCTGVQPFRGENVQAIMMQHMNSIPTPPAYFNNAITPLLTMVIMRGMAKDTMMRFASASSMTAGLAEALNVPVPPDIHSSAQLLDEMSGPTYLSPLQSNPMPHLTPTLSPYPRQMSQPMPSLAPTYPVPISSGQGNRVGNPTTPMPFTNTPGGSSPVYAAQGLPNVVPPQPSASPPLQTQAPLPKTRRRRGLLIGLVALAIIVIVGGSLGGFYWLTHSQTTTVVANNQIVGHAYFISSGQISEHNNQGINDEMLIGLQNIHAPASGNSYYAWLLPDLAHPLSPPIALGVLPVVNGQVHYLYRGDSNHTNLLAITSRYLITEESTSTSPSNPSPDKSTWRYSAQLPQTPDSMDMAHEGVLQHLRHLLADAPELMSINLPGGLDIWLFRNAQKILEWSGSARDFWENKNPSGIRNQVIRILDYLDGTMNVQQDVPPGTPNLVNPRIAPLALLQMGQQNQMPQQQMSASSGLLYIIGIHLGALVQAPGISQENHLLAARIDQDSNNVQALLQKVRTYAKQLVTMTDAQLLSNSTLSLLDSMETAARYAYIGQIDPNTDTVQGGVVEIHYTIERLATFDIAKA
jgi:eukaryotic-like serine/threonine-protein kinase